MALDDEVNAEQDDQAMMPGTSTEDQLTYDPTQGKGTDAWQASVARQAQLNERLKQNAQYRRN